MVLLYVRPDWLQGWDDSASRGGYRLETGLLYQGWGRALYHCSYPNTVVYMCCSYTSLMMLILRSRVWSRTAVTDPLSSEDLSRLTEHPLPNHPQSPRSKGYNLGLPRTSFPESQVVPGCNLGLPRTSSRHPLPGATLDFPKVQVATWGPDSLPSGLHVYLVTSWDVLSYCQVKWTAQESSWHSWTFDSIL